MHQVIERGRELFNIKKEANLSEAARLESYTDKMLSSLPIRACEPQTPKSTSANGDEKAHDKAFVHTAPPTVAISAANNSNVLNNETACNVQAGTTAESVGYSPITLPQSSLRYITKQASRLIGNYGYVYADFLDIKHEIIRITIDKIRKYYDRSKSKLTTFISRVVPGAVSSMVKHRRAQKRHSRLIANSLSSNDDDISAPSIYGCSQGHKRPEMLRDLRIDLENVISKLSLEYQIFYKITIGLISDNPSRKVEPMLVAELSWKPSKVRKYLKILKKHFTAYGIEVYLCDK